MPTQFHSPGQFYQEVAGAADSPSRTKKLCEMLAAGSDENTEVRDAGGGFLVPQEFSAAIWQRAWDFSRVYRRCTRLSPVSGGSIAGPVFREESRSNGSRLGGVSSAWREQTTAIPQSLPQFGQTVLAPAGLAVLVAATEELIADSPVLEQTLTMAAGEEMGVRVDDSIINGTGIGMPLGFVGDAGTVTVTPPTGAPAGQITRECLIAMVESLWPYSLADAVWLVSSSALSNLLGNPDLKAFLSFDPSATDGARIGLYGMPVITVEQGQTVGTVGDICLAALSEYIVADMGDVQVTQSMHVRFINHERMFKFYYRCSGKSRWQTPVTQMYGTLQQSAFVTLATR